MRHTTIFLLLLAVAAGAAQSQISEQQAEARLRSMSLVGDRGRLKAVWTADRPALARYLRGEDVVLARMAATEAGKRKDAALVPVLLETAQKRRDETVSVAATKALGRIGSDAARTGLRRLLKDARAPVRIAAGLALAERGERIAIPALQEALRLPDVRLQPVEWQWKWRTGVMRSTRDWFSYRLDVVRDSIAAARHLARFGDRQSAPQVRKLVMKLDPATRRRLCPALAEFGDPESVQMLMRMLRNEPYSGTRAHAALALGTTGNRAVKPLIAALRDRSVIVRRDAAKSLAVLGDPSAIPALERAMTEKAADAANAPQAHRQSLAAIFAAIDTLRSATNQASRR